MGESCLKAFKFALNKCSGNLSAFTKIMWHQYDHFCDWNHEHCTHSEEYEPVSWNWVTEETAQIALKAEFQRVINNSDKYCQNPSSNVCEAFGQQQNQIYRQEVTSEGSISIGCHSSSSFFLCQKGPVISLEESPVRSY